MTENSTVGVDTRSGAAEQPVQTISQQAQPPIENDVTRMLAEFGGKLDGFGKELRGLQGRQDKAETDFRKQLARFNQIKGTDLTDEQALAEMENIDANERRWQDMYSKLDSLAERIAGGGTQANGQQQVAKVFESIGLDVRDPRVASALLTQYKSADEVELAAYRLQRTIQQNPNPTPAQSPSMQGSGQQITQAQADEKLVQLQGLYKDYSKNRPQIEALEAELKGAGLLK